MLVRVASATLLTLAAFGVALPGSDRAGTALLGAALAVLALGGLSRRERPAVLEPEPLVGPELDGDYSSAIADAYAALERAMGGTPPRD